jgi:hypothetical protein
MKNITTHHIRCRVEEQCNIEVCWKRKTYRTLGEVKNTMEDETTRGMASLLLSDTRRNPRKLVCRLGTAQRYHRMDNLATKLRRNLLI